MAIVVRYACLLMSFLPLVLDVAGLELTHGTIIGTRMVQKPRALLLSLKSQSWLGVPVKPKEGNNHDLVEDQGAYHEEDKTEQLKGVELLSLSVDLHGHEEDPDQKGPGCVNSRPLGGRSVLGYGHSEAIEKGHCETDCDAINYQVMVGSEVIEGALSVLKNSVRAKLIDVAWNMLEDGKEA